MTQSSPTNQDTRGSSSEGGAETTYAEQVARQYKSAFPKTDELAIAIEIQMTSLRKAQTAAFSRFFGEAPSLTAPRWALLRMLYLRDSDAKTQNDIKNELGVTSATVTFMVDALEGEGLVVRLPHPTDRRTTVVELTDNGRNVTAAYLPRIVELFEAFTKGLTSSEKATLLDLLEKLQVNTQSIGSD